MRNPRIQRSTEGWGSARIGVSGSIAGKNMSGPLAKSPMRMSSNCLNALPGTTNVVAWCARLGGPERDAVPCQDMQDWPIRPATPATPHTQQHGHMVRVHRPQTPSHHHTITRYRQPRINARIWKVKRRFNLAARTEH